MHDTIHIIYGNLMIFHLADRQVQIVELCGLELLLPLTKSTDIEVQRLAAHALANLSVNCILQEEKEWL